MVWLNLFKVNSIKEGLKVRKSGYGTTIAPRIAGRNKVMLRGLFNMTNMPFLYNRKDIIGTSMTQYPALNKKILKKEEKRIEKITKLRAGIAQAIVKTDAYKQDMADKRPYKGLDLLFMEAQQYLAGKNVSSITTVIQEEEDQMLEELNTTKKPQGPSAPDGRRTTKKPPSNESVHRKGIVSPAKGTSRKYREVLKSYKTFGVFDREGEDDKKKKKGK